MHDFVVNGFKFNDEFNNGKKTIVANMAEGKSIVGFEFNMIKNNPTLGFLDVDILQINNLKKIVFQVDTKEKVVDSFKKNEMSKFEFLDLINNIFRIINTSKDFMLDTRKILLDIDYLYIEKSNNMPYLIFVPVDAIFVEDVKKQYFKLCSSIYKKYVKQREKVNEKIDSAIQKILKGSVEFSELEELFMEAKSSFLKKKSGEEKDSEENDTKIEEKEIEEPQKVVEEEPVKKIKKEEEILPYEDIVDEEETNNNIVEDTKSDVAAGLIDENLENEFSNQKVENTASEKTNRMLMIQLIVVMLIGSLVVLLSLSDKGFSMLMMIVVIFDLLFCIAIALLYKKNKKHR